MATYQQFEHMADRIGAVPANPRTAARKIHRNNLPATKPNNYYQRALAIPLLDTLVTELDFRFQQGFYMCIHASLSVPSVLCSGTFDSQLNDVIELYKERLPNHEVIH